MQFFAEDLLRCTYLVGAEFFLSGLAKGESEI